MSLHPGGAGHARWARAHAAAPPFDAPLLQVCDALELDRALALRAHELSALPAELDPSARDALAVLVLALLVAQERGSTRLGIHGRAATELSALLDEMQEGGLGQTRGARVRELAAQVVAGRGGEGGAFAPAVVGPESSGPLVVAGDYLYVQRLFAIEGRIAASVAARLPHEGGSDAGRSAAVPSALDEVRLERALRDVIAAPAYAGDRALRLSREQLGAVRVAAQAPLALVSGGPGTGKTSIVVSLLRVLVRLGYDPETDIALSAPTGKAADRMRSSVSQALRALRAPTFDDMALLRTPPRSQTLHRLLGFSPRTGRYRAHARNPLGARVVIVDEASMIDVAMMDRLLRALAPSTRLVLLGDADQLPSVDAGAVFRDLCTLRGDAVVRLTHSYRMDAKDPAGRTILSVARAVHRGKVQPLWETASDTAIVPRANAGALTFHGCEWVHASGADARAAFLARWDERYLRPLLRAAQSLGGELLLTQGHPDESFTPSLRALFAQLEAARLLALTRAGALGVERVNRQFHAQRSQDPRARLAVGEPIMVHQNDYVRGLFNGDTGIVLTGRFDFERAPRRLALFRRDDGFVGFPLVAIEPIVDLAYAITVHKAQGSEFDAVAVLMPDVDTPLLTREILYTAITRARSSVTLVGSRGAIETATGRPVTRSSGLRERVQADLAG
ncbi:MAG: exodeoxyribonuclease V subunit alpha [Sandaracinaceae bacterium]|nr:exodeoxyribonuclease V subunit alpha [Sandaracinaceae bacterium]